MTTTLQQALLKAGLVSKDQLKKAEAEKMAVHSQRGSAASDSLRDADRSARSGRGRQPRRGVEGRAPRALPRGGATRAPINDGKHHHHIRTECDACGKGSPDVEYYEHKNRSLDKYWLCVKCADNHNISDEFRQTKQSQHAMTRLFQRGYGATKIFK